MEPLRKAERIAALLDGRLDARERASLLAELGASDDDLELLLDSAAITRELEAEDAAAGAPPATASPAVVTADPRPAEVIPITAAPSRRRRARWWEDARALAAAAVLVLAVGSSFWLARSRVPGSPVDALGEEIRALPAGWQYPWPQTRGVGSDIGPAAVPFRFGVLVTDLEIAARAHDAVSADTAAVRIDSLFSHTRPLLAGDYSRMAAEPAAPSLAHVRRQAAETTDALDRDMVELGRWAEAARLAAAHRQAEFFRSGIGRHYVEAGDPEALNGAGRAALGRVRNALGNRGVPDWPRLEQALVDLLEAAG